MIQPYYQDDTVTLYHGDSRVILPELGSGSADLIVTDPPYGMAFQSGLRADAFRPIEGDGDRETAANLTGAVMAAAVSVLREGRHAYVFGRHDLASVPALAHKTELIWDKSIVGPGDLTSPWGPQHEYVQFYVRIASQQNRKDGKGRLSARLRRGSVIKVQRPNSRQVKAHPTEKPVPLLRELIESSSVIGETVLDPFAGSGSTLEAAVLEGRRAVGIELDEAYCKGIADRLRTLRRAA